MKSNDHRPATKRRPTPKAARKLPAKRKPDPDLFEELWRAGLECVGLDPYKIGRILAREAQRRTGIPAHKIEVVP